jgi:ATP-binding cassette subfamily B protein
MDKIKLIWKYMRGRRFLYLMSVLSIGVAAFIQFLWPLVLRITIDSIIGDQPLEISGWLAPFFKKLFVKIGEREFLVEKLWLIATVMVMLTLIQGVFTYLKGRWSAIASEAIIKNLRDNLYEHLQ